VTLHLTDEQIRAGWACPVCGKTGFATARGTSKHLAATAAEPVIVLDLAALDNYRSRINHEREQVA